MGFNSVFKGLISTSLTAKCIPWTKQNYCSVPIPVFEHREKMTGIPVFGITVSQILLGLHKATRRASLDVLHKPTKNRQLTTDRRALKRVNKATEL